MSDGFDLFFIFRWFLAVVCTIYAVVVSLQTLWGWLTFFRSSRYNLLAGRYASVLLLRLKLRRFWWELCQITALLVMLGYLVYLHRGLGQTWGMGA